MWGRASARPVGLKPDTTLALYDVGTGFSPSGRAKARHHIGSLLESRTQPLDLATPLLLLIVQRQCVDVHLDRHPRLDLIDVLPARPARPRRRRTQQLRWNGDAGAEVEVAHGDSLRREACFVGRTVKRSRRELDGKQK